MYDLKRKSCVLSSCDTFAGDNNTRNGDFTTLAKKQRPSSNKFISTCVESGADNKLSLDNINSCAVVTNSCLPQFNTNISFESSTLPSQSEPSDDNMDVSSAPYSCPVIYSQPRSCIMCAAGDSGHINHILR
ncbi:uncharacterized protein LOC115229675 [Octopus sinensis]|uniref:Uncharacterized protein LOC115229675 n=1 Tax=Octopus sinensis TaxID=2607531 RepID=A0A6P7U0V6_9MOLL|nr:uncharacterized protein LOC115229675 [Octopus sinensis]